MSLVLSPLQQRWLQELQVATPFIAPYRAKKTRMPEPQVKAVVEAPEPMLEPRAEKVCTSEPVKVADLAQMGLIQLQAHAEQCQACELHQHRTQIVLGAGQTQQPEWFVISTAPSSNEELSGLPMQAKSGELFTAQMQSIGVNIQQQMYLTQLLKCRSLTSKTSIEHIKACQGILLRQIEVIQPRRLLLLGSKAAALFLDINLSFEELRGRVHSWKTPQGHTLPVVVSYHPASLLLRPQFKAQAWQDLQLIASMAQF